MHSLILFTVFSAFLALQLSEFSQYYRLYKLGPSYQISLPRNFIYQFSFSETSSPKALTKFSGSDLDPKSEYFDPDKIFSKLDSEGKSWVDEQSTNDLEFFLDGVRLILKLQLDKHEDLTTKQKEATPSDLEEITNGIEESTIFLNKILKYASLLVTGIIEKKLKKFELDTAQIVSSERFSDLQLAQRDLNFLRDVSSYLKSLLFIFDCKGLLTKNSELCKYLAQVYSYNQCKLQKMSTYISNTFLSHENSPEHVKAETHKPRQAKRKPKTARRRFIVLRNKSTVVKRKFGKTKFIYKSKAKNVVIRKNPGSKPKKTKSND